MVHVLQQWVSALDILDVDVPKDTQEEGARENDDDQLQYFVELNDEKSIQYWVGVLVSLSIVPNVVF